MSKTLNTQILHYMRIKPESQNVGLKTTEMKISVRIIPEIMFLPVIINRDMLVPFSSIYHTYFTHSALNMLTLHEATDGNNVMLLWIQ